MNDVDWRHNTWLGGMVLVLWSYGRVLNPIRRAYSEAGTTPTTAVEAATWIYLGLHVAVFAFTGYLLVNSLFYRRGTWSRGRALELLLYTYVLITLLLSCYFLLYQEGLLPASLSALLPYPFNLPS